LGILPMLIAFFSGGPISPLESRPVLPGEVRDVTPVDPVDHGRVRVAEGAGHPLGSLPSCPEGVADIPPSYPQKFPLSLLTLPPRILIGEDYPDDEGGGER
jgi:hypothetical protein